MAKKTKAARKTTRKSVVTKRPRAMTRRATASDSRVARVQGAERRDVAGVRVDIGRAGDARIKRVVYPAGFKWSADMKSIVGTDLCMHAHVGFLVRGSIRITYPDGCVVDYKAPAVLAIEPGHDGRVIGRDRVEMIELDFERETIPRLGMPEAHRHT